MDCSDQAVRLRAYEIWEREGRPEGSEHRHWAQALREIAVISSETRPGTQAAVDKLKTAAIRTAAAPKARRSRKSSKAVSA